MLLVVFILMIVVGVILYRKLYDSDLEVIGGIIVGIGAVVVIASLAVIAFSYIDTDALQLQDQERYKAITYKIESNIYKDNINLNDKDLIDEIAEWNKDVLYYQKMQRNFWVGIYYPNIADNYKLIDYSDVK